MVNGSVISVLPSKYPAIPENAIYETQKLSSDQQNDSKNTNETNEMKGNKYLADFEPKNPG
jgi:hypothetical protein